jgi:hypothetical protein
MGRRPSRRVRPALEFLSPEQYAARYRAHFGRDPDLSDLERSPRDE